ncbi:MAG: DUF624 domain-containing protein [Candidatus Izemoplasmataceae bacterium]
MSFFDRYTNSKFYSFFELLYFLIILNILWLLTSFVGFVVFTLFPATIAVYLFILHRKDERDFKFIRTFLIIIKREYIKSQKLFLVILLMGFIITSNLIFYYNNLEFLSMLHFIGLVMTLLIGIAYLLTIIHIIPVYIFFHELKTLPMIKYAFLMSFAYLFRSLASLGFFIGLILLSLLVQPIFVFGFISILLLTFCVIIEDKYIRLLKGKDRIKIQDYIPE